LKEEIDLKNRKRNNSILGYQIASEDEKIEYFRRTRKTESQDIISIIFISSWEKQEGDYDIARSNLFITDVVKINKSIFGTISYKRKATSFDETRFVIKIANLKSLIRQTFLSYIVLVERNIYIFYTKREDGFMNIYITEEYEYDASPFYGCSLEIRYNPRLLDVLSIIGAEKGDVYYTNKAIKVINVVKT
jgi:hypothetical protein